jgi:electron transfer flavoprotein beta subunit
MIAVCVKWVDRRPEIDPVSGAAAGDDDRYGGLSPADEAAIEWALRVAEARGDSVTVVTAGRSSADAGLRAALAAGAAAAVRVDLDPAASSVSVAEALAAVVADATIVLCGDHSADRGSGSVPAFLSADLGVAQALGLVQLDVTADGIDHQISATRRLDGARRELLSITGRCVLSVEGSTARLRRASLAGTVAARQATIDVRQGPAVDLRHGNLAPFRPRARALAAPAGTTALGRVLSITDALSDREPPQRLELDPAAAADRILAALKQWGERR